MGHMLSTVCDMLLRPMRHTKIQPWKNRRDMVYRYVGLILLKTSLKPWNPVSDLFPDDVCNRHGEFVLTFFFFHQVFYSSFIFCKGSKNVKI